MIERGSLSDYLLNSQSGVIESHPKLEIPQETEKFIKSYIRKCYCSWPVRIYEKSKRFIKQKTRQLISKLEKLTQ